MIDPSRYITSCEYDLCSDANSRFQNVFMCSIAAAYARDCRLANVVLDWFSDPDLKKICQDAQYGQCTGGAAYSDCAPKCSQTCYQMANSNQSCYERECIAGCACPSQSYLDSSVTDKPQCIPQNKCPCYDSESNKYFQTEEIVARACGNW